MKKELQDTRKDYTLKALDREHISDDPINQFTRWYKEYIEAEPIDVNAMTLSTVSEDGYPASRVVLLKGVADGGFEFYTNYNSDKGIEMKSNPNISLNFFWPELERQVRVEGQVVKLTEAESDEYFNSRPLGSRIGAWASPQSQVIENREVLEERLEELEKRFEKEEVTRPPHWGGYRVMPKMIEFWQGRPSRLHDRMRYILLKDDSWKIERLAP